MAVGVFKMVIFADFWIWMSIAQPFWLRWRNRARSLLLLPSKGEWTLWLSSLRTKFLDLKVNLTFIQRRKLRGGFCCNVLRRCYCWVSSLHSGYPLALCMGCIHPHRPILIYFQWHHVLCVCSYNAMLPSRYYFLLPPLWNLLTIKASTSPRPVQLWVQLIINNDGMNNAAYIAHYHYTEQASDNLLGQAHRFWL